MKLYYVNRGSLGQSDEALSLLKSVFEYNYKENLPDIKKTSAGKPYFPGRLDIHFSISHSKAHIFCGLSSYPIGVDIENERHISEQVKKYYCSSEELKHFDPLDLWVLKESYVKLFGLTLASIKNITFFRESDDIIPLYNLDNKDHAHNNIRPLNSHVNSKLYKLDNFRAAVSTTGNFLPETIETI